MLMWIYYVYAHIYVYTYVCLYVSEMNDSNDTIERRKESGFFLKYSHYP